MAPKKLREPKVDKLFAAIFRPATRSLEERRYRGMANLPGVIPIGPVTDESEVEYYTDKVQRTTSKVDVSDLEAKSAIDDLTLKRAGTATFFLMVLLAILFVGIDEFFANTKVDVTRPANITMTILGTLLVNGGLFMIMRSRFQQMDQNWGNSIDSFYGTGAKRQMEAVRDCMREFKRFLKWRRYMRLVIWFALSAMIVEVIVLLRSDEIMSRMAIELLPGMATKIAWSASEQAYTLGFLAAQILWLGIYWWMYVYYTTYRDPTLHMTVLVNVMDRQSLQPIISQSR